MIPQIGDTAHTCLSCDWFRFPGPADYEESKAAARLPPLRNRMCRFPGKLVMDKETRSCGCWRNCYSRRERVLALLHLKKLKRRSITR